MPPGFPCAELLPCAVLHDLYGSAEQDLTGSLKHSHMEYRKLFTVHTATLRLKNCYSRYCDYHYHCCCSYTSFSLSMSHIVVLLGSKMFDLCRRLASLHFRGTVCVPLDILLLLCFHVSSGLSVLLFTVYVQLRQNVPCSTQWCSAITSS